MASNVGDLYLGIFFITVTIVGGISLFISFEQCTEALKAVAIFYCITVMVIFPVGWYLILKWQYLLLSFKTMNFTYQDRLFGEKYIGPLSDAVIVMRNEKRWGGGHSLYRMKRVIKTYSLIIELPNDIALDVGCWQNEKKAYNILGALSKKGHLEIKRTSVDFTD